MPVGGNLFWSIIHTVLNGSYCGHEKVLAVTGIHYGMWQLLVIAYMDIPLEHCFPQHPSVQDATSVRTDSQRGERYFMLSHQVLHHGKQVMHRHRVIHRYCHSQPPRAQKVYQTNTTITCAASGMFIKLTGSEWISLFTSLTTYSRWENLNGKDQSLHHLNVCHEETDNRLQYIHVY